MSHLRAWSALLALGLWTIASAPGLAEVGVMVQDGATGATTVSAYELDIVDDPDPIGSRAWKRYHEDDANRKILNAEGFENGDGPPSILYNRFSGQVLVAWAKNNPSGYDVVLSSFDGTAWSAPVTLTATLDSELDPFLVVDPVDGTVHLFYWIEKAQPLVMHRAAPSDLSSWSAPAIVSQPAELAVRPAALYHDGSLTVVYESHPFGYTTTPREIVLATEQDGVFSAEVLASTYHSGPNWPQVHGVGDRLWVEWIDAPGEMGWIRQVSPGIWDPIQLEAYQTLEERDYHIRGEIKAQALE
jgi:hypothetical protein